MLNCPPDLLNSVKDLSIFLMRPSYIFVAALWYSYKLCAVYLGLSFVCVMILMHVIGDGGFFLTCEDFLRRLDHSFPACELKKKKISLCTLIPLFRPGSVHSGSVSRDNCDQVFLDKLCVSSSSGRLPHYAWKMAYSTHSDFVGSRLYACV